MGSIPATIKLSAVPTTRVFLVASFTSARASWCLKRMSFDLTSKVSQFESRRELLIFFLFFFLNITPLFGHGLYF